MRNGGAKEHAGEPRKGSGIAKAHACGHRPNSGGARPRFGRQRQLVVPLAPDKMPVKEGREHAQGPVVGALDEY